MRWTLEGTHREGGVAVCDRCGKPRQVRFADVRPAGFAGPSPFGDLLPCACDCHERDEAAAAVRAMLAAPDRPMVAYRESPSDDALRSVLDAWLTAIPANFAAWLDLPNHRCCLTGKFVWQAIRDGRMRMTHRLAISCGDGRSGREEAATRRQGLALLVPVGSMGAVA